MGNIKYMREFEVRYSLFITLIESILLERINLEENCDIADENYINAHHFIQKEVCRVSRFNVDIAISEKVQSALLI